MASSSSDDLWRKCADWLVRCKILPADHRSNWLTSEIKTLALTLRDGVLLCNLVHFLDPTMEAIEFNRKPRDAQFLCLQNIRIFLECCRNNFQLKENELFECGMLYDLTNFHRVLITLSILSQSRKVQKNHPNLAGFSYQSVANERNYNEEDIYKELHLHTNTSSNNDGSHKASDESANNNYATNSELIKWTSDDLVPIDDIEEKIYEDLCYVTISSFPYEVFRTISLNMVFLMSANVYYYKY